MTKVDDDLVVALVESEPMISGLEIMSALRMSWRQAWKVLRRLERAGLVVAVVVNEGGWLYRKRYVRG